MAAAKKKVVKKSKVSTTRTPGSIKVVTTKAIVFQELWANYPAQESILHKDAKGNDIIKNYCALKVSHTLLTSGVEMKSFGGGRCSNCPLGMKHVLGATQLAAPPVSGKLPPQLS